MDVMDWLWSKCWINVMAVSTPSLKSILVIVFGRHISMTDFLPWN